MIKKISTILVLALTMSFTLFNSNSYATEITQLAQVTEQEAVTAAEQGDYSWVNINTILPEKNVPTVSTITIDFTNTETKEVITKTLLSSEKYNNIIKLNYGTYKVSVSSSINDLITYEDTFTVSSSETNYSLTLKEQVKEDKPKHASLTSILLNLIKQNAIFIVLLILCSGYLLRKEMKRRSEES